MRKIVPLLFLLATSLAGQGYGRAETPISKATTKQQLQLAQTNLKRSRLAAKDAQLRAQNAHLAAQRAQEQLQLAQLRLEAANKKLVLTFYQRFFGDKDITAADQYLAPSYIQHNPSAATGRDAVKKFFTPFFANPAIPKTKIDVRRAAADGDLVWLHIRSKTTGQERAVVDIFRVKNGKIVEHWDVVQPVPAHSANNNTMF